MDSAGVIFQRMCRCCMMLNQNFHSIYGDAQNRVKICEMLATVTPQLLIRSSNELPQQLCVTCLRLLNIAYSFQQMCIATEKQLLNVLCAENVLVANELSFADTTATKSEKNENPQDIKDIIVDEVGLSAQQLEASKIEAEGKTEKSCASANSLASGSNEIEVEVDKDEEPHKPSRISHMPNETDVIEIEKPSTRNLCFPNLACPHCDKLFDRVYNFKRHILVVHSEKRQFKVQSSKECEDPKALKKIKKRPSPPPDGFKCPECPRRFERRRSLAAHMHIHLKTIDIQTFKCDMCPKKFHKLTELARHGQTHPENQNYKCRLCKKTFALEAHFIVHMNKHKGLKPYVCVDCNKGFRSDSVLIDHQRSHTGEKPYSCAQCKKSFRNAGNLKQHQLRHSDEKRFKCPECPSKFICQSDQIRHTATHRFIKPHKCDICGSCFARSQSLSVHKKRHIGERPQKCEECNRSFIFLYQLKRHQLSHTFEKRYKCTFCDHAFAWNADLNKHLSIHSGEKTTSSATTSAVANTVAVESMDEVKG